MHVKCFIHLNYENTCLYLSVLIDLGEALDPVHDQTQKDSIIWMVRKFGDLHSSCASYVQLRSKAKEVPKEGSMEEKKRKARERAMKAMKLNAIKFSAHVKDEESVKEETIMEGEEPSSVINRQGDKAGREDKHGAEGSSDRDIEESDKNTTLCIVCQSDGEEKSSIALKILRNTPAIGLLAFSQLSRAQSQSSAGCCLSSTMWLAPETEVNRSGYDEFGKRNSMGEDGEVHLSFCGHGALSLFSSFLARTYFDFFDLSTSLLFLSLSQLSSPHNI